MLRLDHDSPIPLRAQVEHLVRMLVRQQKYQKGALLPDEETLAAKLGVSRGTVRAGISRLVFEGLLVRKPGIGTRLSGKNAESGILAWRSFTREMASKGITVENFHTTFRQDVPGPDVTHALNIKAAVAIWRLDRLRGWDGQPILHTTSWFHPRLRLTGTESQNLPLYEMVEKATGVTPHSAREDFFAENASKPFAVLLGIKAGDPLLVRRHTVYDQGNRPFEFAEIRYVSSRFTLTLGLHREKP